MTTQKITTIETPDATEATPQSRFAVPLAEAAVDAETVLSTSAFDAAALDSAAPGSSAPDSAGLGFETSNDYEPAAAATPKRPRIRWAAIVWGLLFAAASSTALYVLLDPSRIDDFEAWVSTLSPVTASLYVLLLLGGLVLVGGLVGLLRRLQKRVGAES